MSSITKLKSLLDRAKSNELVDEDKSVLKDVLEELKMCNEIQRDYFIIEMLLLANLKNFNVIVEVLDYMCEEKVPLNGMYVESVRLLEIFANTSIENKVKIGLFLVSYNIEALPRMNKTTCTSFIRQLIACNVDKDIEFKVYKAYVKLKKYEKFEHALADVMQTCLLENSRPEFTLHVVEELNLYNALMRYYHILKRFTHANCKVVWKKLKHMRKEQRKRGVNSIFDGNSIDLFFTNGSVHNLVPTIEYFNKKLLEGQHGDEFRREFHVEVVINLFRNDNKTVHFLLNQFIDRTNIEYHFRETLSIIDYWANIRPPGLTLFSEVISKVIRLPSYLEMIKINEIIEKYEIEIGLVLAYCQAPVPNLERKKSRRLINYIMYSNELPFNYDEILMILKYYLVCITFDEELVHELIRCLIENYELDFIKNIIQDLGLHNTIHRRTKALNRRNRLTLRTTLGVDHHRRPKKTYSIGEQMEFFNMNNVQFGIQVSNATCEATS